jgi:hypothetical protein
MLTMGGEVIGIPNGVRFYNFITDENLCGLIYLSIFKTKALWFKGLYVFSPLFMAILC